MTSLSFSRAGSNMGSLEGYMKNTPGFNGRLQTQQPIIYNANVPLQLSEWRSETVNNTKIPIHKKFTPVLTRGLGDPFDLLHYAPLEPAFYYRQNAKISGSSDLKESRIDLVQTLNGALIDDNIKTQAEFEDQFIYAGLPLRGFFFGKGGQMPMGLAMMVAGSKNLWNRGRTTWYPGDPIGWRMPNIDMDLRNDERKLLPQDREHPEMRETAIVERLTYEDCHCYIQDAITRSFDENKIGQYSFVSTIPNSNKYVSSVDRFVIALRSFTSLVSISTVLMLMAYNIDPNITPGDNGKQDPLSYESFNGNNLLFDKRLTDVLFRKGQRDDVKGITSVTKNLMSTDEKTAFANRALYWIGQLGGSPAALGPHNQPAHNLIDQIFGMSIRPLLLDKHMHNYFSIGRFFPDSFKVGAFENASRSAADVSRAYNLSNPVGSALYLQSSAPKDMFSSLGRAVELKMNRIVGYSLNHTAPGEWGDTYV